MNRGASRRSPGGAVWGTIAAANAAAALPSGGFAAAALVDPGLLPEGMHEVEGLPMLARGDTLVPEGVS